MSEFQLSEQADPNKIFLVKRSELEGRLDPVMILYQRKIQNLKYPTKNLGSILKSNPQYGANEAGINRQSRNELRYIRITDIDNYGLLKNTIGKTASKIEEQYLLNFNDLLLARSGSVGRSYLHKNVDEKSIFAGYLIRFILDENKINPNYVFSYTQLNIYKEWVNAIQRTVAQPNINAEEYKSLKIPIPPKNIQADIVAKMDKAYHNKKTKETQAQQLLDGIDGYLLGELGINLPKQTDNSLTARIFTKKWSDITGGRFDPKFHLLDRTKQKCNYSFYKLKSFTEIKKGNSITKENIISGDIPVIAGGQTSPYNHYVANYNGNVITVSASGAYAGYIWYHSMPIFASDCSVISSKDNDISIQYIAEYLKSHQQYIYNLQQGAAQPHIYPSDLEQLEIPLPPLKKQNQIAQHISQIRENAKQLQTEAKTGLEQAKTEVETMILGGKT